jgi:hypothetical protein
MTHIVSGPKLMVHICFPSLKCIGIIILSTHDILPHHRPIDSKPLITTMGDPSINSLDHPPKMDLTSVKSRDLYSYDLQYVSIE